MVWLGASITQTDGPAPSGTDPTSGYRPLTMKWLQSAKTDYEFSSVNSGVGGTGSWYALTRLQADCIDHAPDYVIMDVQVNDGTTDHYHASQEALIRRLRAALPNARLIVVFFLQVADYLSDDDTNLNEAAKLGWIALCEKYEIEYADYAVVVQGMAPETYPLSDFLYDSVHPTSFGHMIAHETLRVELSDAWLAGGLQWSGDLDDYERTYALSEDYENTPTIKTGVQYDSKTGTWTEVGSTISSATVDSTITFSATCQSVGIDTGDGSTNPSVGLSIDGGAYANYVIHRDGMSIGTRGTHTVTLKVLSGTIKISRFLAI